jgi:hypothetical protein
MWFLLTLLLACHETAPVPAAADDTSIPEE